MRLHNDGRDCAAALPTNMRVLVWNCRGIGNPRAVPALSLLVRQEKPDILCLMETKTSSMEFEKLKWKLQFNGGLGISGDGRKGGMGILWNNEVKVSIQSYGHNYVDSILQESDTLEPWRFTLLYGEPTSSNKEETWRLMHNLNSSSQMKWVVGGNEILNIQEKTGAIRPTWQVENFQSFRRLRSMGFGLSRL